MTEQPTPDTKRELDLDALEKLAREATPGEWRVAEDNNPFADRRHVFATGFDGSDFVVLNLKTDHTFVTATSREQQQKNALFSAAANPATILALIAQARAPDRARDDLVEALKPFARYLDVLETMGGNTPRSGTYCGVTSSSAGDAEITIEDMQAARSALSRAGS